jgi:hypothetical protein
VHLQRIGGEVRRLVADPFEPPREHVAVDDDS